MNITKQELIDIIQGVVDATLLGLEERGVIGSARGANNTKTPVQRTEHLLLNYINLKRIVASKRQEIAELQACGASQRESGVVAHIVHSATPKGCVQDEDSVQIAIKRIEKSMESTVQAITSVERALEAIKDDPYYRAVVMLYFEGRAQSDIALEYNCTQQNVSYHIRRLVKELSGKLFPDTIVEESWW